LDPAGIQEVTVSMQLPRSLTVSVTLVGGKWMAYSSAYVGTGFGPLASTPLHHGKMRDYIPAEADPRKRSGGTKFWMGGTRYDQGRVMRITEKLPKSNPKSNLRNPACNYGMVFRHAVITRNASLSRGNCLPLFA
jgi:hypothetical protein